MVSAMLLNTSRLSVARVHAAVASVVATDAESKTGRKSKARKTATDAARKKAIISFNDYCLFVLDVNARAVGVRYAHSVQRVPPAILLIVMTNRGDAKV